MTKLSTAGLLQLHNRDNVAVATRPLESGTRVADLQPPLQLAFSIKMGHKVAIRDIASGEQVLKYGQTIGLATKSIEAGDWVHTHNLANQDTEARVPRSIELSTAIPPDPVPRTSFTFEGFRRPDGRSGTRNYIGVISSVNCSATVARAVARHYDASRLAEYPNIDGVVAFTHGTGCGMPFDGPSHQMLNRVLAGIARHPNIGAFVLIGLGCEQNTLGHLVGTYQLQTNNLHDPQSPVPVISIQDSGGTRSTIDSGIQAVEQLLPQANDVHRETIPASELVVATECGGSDAYSGITANPAVGAAADLLVACGSTVILAETTEAYGAEHLLTRRARRPEIASRLLEKIEWWKWYASLFGAELDNNPSPGNKEGGLTTIAEKSLGAIAKGGTTALEGVFDYAERITQRGFVFMDSPGFDPPSVTGMVASGANLVVFTTGRGSCFGCKPTPTLKVATNTPMFERMREDMDIDAGVILDDTPVAELGERIFNRLLEVASGSQTVSEAQGIGDEEFVPWTIGPVL